MAARTLYKVQASRQTLSFNPAEFFYLDDWAARRLVAAGAVVAIDALPGTAVLAPGVPLRHQLRREAMPPPVDEADRVVVQHLAGVLGGAP